MFTSSPFGLRSASRFQVSGFPPQADQQKNATYWNAGAHKMNFLSPVLAFSLIRIRVQTSGFCIH
jgi:hypothetical protein